jgi:CRISPR-associated exonuclease Cas4
MEHASDDVSIGKLISETTYERNKHEIHIDNLENDIVLDFFDKKKKIIHEVKKSKKMEELHIWQVKYYIYVLERLGIDGVKGKIDYPKLKRIVDVELKDEDRQKLNEVFSDINIILQKNNPPSIINKPYCKKCSYYEFCYC